MPRKVDPRKLARLVALKRRRLALIERQAALQERRSALHERRAAQLEFVRARSSGHRLRDALQSQALVRVQPPAPAPMVVYQPAAERPAPPVPDGIYMTLEEAERALARARRDDPEQLGQSSSPSLATGIAIGLAAVAVLGLGVVVCYLLFRKKDDGTAQQVLGLPPQVIVRDIVREVSPGSSDRALDYYGRRTHDYEERNDRHTASSEPRVRTMSLPDMTNRKLSAVRIASATDVAFEATVRVVAPIGAFAVLAYTASELSTDGLPSIPAGETMVLPAGESQRLQLSPHQSLYAKGSEEGVVISVSTSEAPN
jgi:hypothetical protein